MLEVAEVLFGEWLPDAPDYKNPGCVVAENVYPSSGGYSPFRGANATSASHAETVQGAEQFYRSGGTPVIVGGSSTRLFHIVGSTLTATTGLTTIGSDAYWDFAQFNQYLIATTSANSPQYLTDIESDTGWSALPSSPPSGKYCARVGNHLVIANIPSASAFTFQTSAENDPTDWPTPGTNDARIKSSLRGTVPREYGPITGMAGDRYPVLFQERAVSRFDPVGPPTVFRIETIEEARGCIAPGSIVTVGFVTYFLAHDGFWATDGNQVFPIGTKRVNGWFFENVSEADRFRTHGAASFRDQCIIWTFYKADDPTGFKRQIIYSWAENRWSSASLEMDYLVQADVTNPANAAETSTVAAFIASGSNSVLNQLIGPSLAATIETADHQPKPGSRVSVNALYPLIEAATGGNLLLETGTDYLLLETGDEIILEVGRVNMALITHDQTGARSTEGSDVLVNTHGFAPVRGDGRFARARLSIAAGASWDKAQGAQIEFRTSGRR